MNDNSEKLRAKAKEELRQGKIIDTSLYQTDMKILVEELSIYQIELEHQNQELIQSQDQLQQSNDRYLDLFENAPIGYMIVDISGVIKNINQTAAKLLDRSKNEFENTKITKFIHPDYQDIYFIYFQSLTNQRHHQPCDIKLRKANNQFFYARIQGVCQSQEVDHEAEFRLAISDISIQKEMEIKLLAAKALTEQSEERFQLLFNKAPLGYQSLDFDGCFIEVNQQWLDTLGFQREEVIGKWFGDFLTPVYQDGFRERFPIFKAQGHIHAEFEMIHKNGSILFIAFDGKIATDEAGNFKQTHCILQDITEKRQAENELRKSEEKYRLLHENAGIGIGYYKVDGTIISYNNIAAKNMNGVPEDFKGKSIYDFFPKSQAEFYHERIKKAVLSEVPDVYEDEVSLPTGNKYFISTFTKIANLNNEIDGIQILSQDITERKQAEIALLEKEKEFRNLIEISPVAMGIIHDWKTIYFNPAAIHLFGAKTLEELLDRHIYELIHPDFHELAIENAKLLAEKGYVNMQEQKYLKLDGSILDVETQAKSIRFNDATATLVVMNDITKRKQAEQALVHSHELMRYVIENNNGAIAIHDKDLKYIYVSQRYLNDYKVEKKDIIGKHHYEVFPDLPQKWRDVHQKALAGVISSADADSYPREDGTLEWTRWECRPWHEADGSIGGIIVYTEVITERMQMVEDLRKSEENLSITLNSIGDGVISTNINGLIVNMNPVAEKLCGWELTDALGKPLKEVFKIINAETRQTVTDPVEKVFEHGEIVGLANHTVLISKDGAEYQIADSAAPIKNKEGEITGVVLVFSDVTEKYAAERLLKLSEERYALVIEASEQGIWDWNVETNEVYFSEQWKKQIGYEDHELKNDFGTWIEHLHSDELDYCMNAIKAYLEQPVEHFKLEFKFRHKDGTYKWIHNKAASLKNNEGKVTRMFGAHTDITERKNAEEALHKSQEMIISSQSVAHICSYSTNLNVNELDKSIWVCSPEFYIVFGIDKTYPHTLAGWAALIHPDHQNELLAYHEYVVKNGISFSQEYKIIRKNDGAERWVHGTGELEYDKQGKPTRMYGAIQDITDRKQTELLLQQKTEEIEAQNEELQQINEELNQTNDELAEAIKQVEDSEARYRSLLENLEAGIVVHAPDTSIVMSNHRAAELLGLSDDQMKGKVAIDPAWKFVHEDITPLRLDEYPVNRIVKSRQPIKDQVSGIHQSDKTDIVWVTVNGFPVIDNLGRITEIVISFIDITERKLAEESLRESEERFKALHNASFGGITIHDNGLILECNQGLSEITGYSYHELIGMDGLLLIASESRDIVRNNIIAGFEQPYEVQGIRKNGEIFPLRLEARNIPYKGKQVRTVEFRDITERKQSELLLQLKTEEIEAQNEELQQINEELYQKNEELAAAIKRTEESEERFNLAMKASNDGLFDWNLVNNSIYYSPGWKKMLGFDEHELPNDFSVWEKTTSPEDVKKSWELQEKLITKQIDRFVIEFKMKHKDGHWLDILSRAEAIFNKDGKAIRIVGTHTDITERKHAEQEVIIAKEKAEESERLKSAFLANMSHEIRTPMNGILGFSEILKEPNLTGDEQQKCISMIEKSGIRMLNIINDIVDISRIEAGLMNLNINETNINEQIEYIYTFFKPEVEAKGMRFSFNSPLTAKEATITTDREKVYAILTNIVKNAIKYSKEGSIEMGYRLKADSKPLELEFYVKDTGIGIPKDRQEAIFERFIQADIADTMAYQGAGLGLAITKAYIEMLGGKIWVESEEGVGSTFYFTLPYNAKTTNEIVVQQLDDSKTNEQIRKLKILIAEDDEVSEILLDKTVNRFASEILKVRSGAEAIIACQKNPDIDLILMDIRMPEMGGYEATRQIREFNKDVVIIAQTAYGLFGERKKATDAGCNDYIAKPIKKEELIALIQKYFS